MEKVLEKLKDLDLDQVKELLQKRNVQYGLVAGVVGVLVLRKLLKRDKFNPPPGPRPWPLIGNMLSMKSMKDINKNFKKWRKTYGDIFTVYLGPMRCVVLASSDAVREAFITKGHDFDGRMCVPSMEKFTDGGKDIFMAQPGPVWKLQRQIAHQAIRKHASGMNLESNLQSAMDSFVTAVNRQDDKVVEINDTMMRMTYNFLASVCFGRHFDYDDPWLLNFQRLIKEMMDEIGVGFIGDFIPMLSFLDRNKMKLMDQLDKEFRKMYEDELNEHRKTFDPDHIRDLTDEILFQLKKLEESDQTNPALSQIEPTHLISILADVFSAGTDSSRITLTIMIGHLAQYPDIQAKVHKELDEVLGDTGKVTLKNKEKLIYTNAVVHESMRIQTAVPTGIPHTTTADTSLGKYTIPKGTTVMPYVYGIHHDPDNFKNPEEFNPDRWIDANGKFQYHAFKFIPFSMGPRVCVGEALARVDLQMFAAMLLHKYEFKSVDGKPFVLKVRDISMSTEAEPYKLKLVERY